MPSVELPSAGADGVAVTALDLLVAPTEMPTGGSDGAGTQASDVLAVRFLAAEISPTASVAGDALLSSGALDAAAAGVATVVGDATPAPALASAIASAPSVAGDLVRYREVTSGADGAASIVSQLAAQLGLASSVAGVATTVSSLGIDLDMAASVSAAPSIAAFMESGGVQAQDIYLQVTGTPTFNNDDDIVTGDPGTWTLPVTLRRGGSTGTRLPTGAALVKWGEYSATPGTDFTGGIILTSDLTYAPYIDVFTVAKNISDTTFPWDDAALKPRVRMGNLHGVLGNSTDKWGIAMSTDLSSTSTPYIEVSNEGLVVSDADVSIINGDFYAGNAGETSYMKWVTGTSTLEVKGTIKADAGSIDGVLSIGTSGGIYQGTGSFATPTTGLKIWNDSGVGRLATYNAGDVQIYLDTSGSLHAGSGVTLDETGLTIGSLNTGTTPPGYIPTAYKLNLGETEIYHGRHIDIGVVDTMFIGFPDLTNSPTTTIKTTSLVLEADDSTFNGSVQVDTTLDVTGDTTIDGDLTITSNNIFGSLAVGARAYRSTAQTLTTGVSTPVNFDTEVDDTDGIWASGTPSRFYAAHDGYYMAGAGIAINTGTTTAFRISLTVRHNIDGLMASSHDYTGANTIYYVSVTTGMFWMAANEYVDFLAYQDSGSNKNISAATATTQHLCNGWLVRVA